ncbi:hypothetical protein FACS1894133_5870 [Clostridia bacterium]|nr:hypothetical protein FACS1894133_5870 [Clostridia bacterium]
MDENRITIGSGETAVECEIITAFEHGGAYYIALMPLVQNDDGEMEIEIFRYREVGDGIELIPIGDDDEYGRIAGILDELMNTETDDVDYEE